MLGKLGKLVAQPGKYVPLAWKIAQQPLSRLFRHGAFHLQGQMDINPRSRWYNAEFVERTGGFFPAGDRSGREICDLDPWDSTRRDMIVLLLRTLLVRGVAGDLAELGVYQGTTARLIHHYMPDRDLHLFDTFQGFTDRSVSEEQQHTSHDVEPGQFADTSVDSVRRYIGSRNGRVHFHPGYFPESIPAELRQRTWAFAHLDADLYEPTLNALEFFYPRMPRGGVLLIHDYNAWPGARKAVDDFFAGRAELPVPMPDKSGSALIVKAAG